MITRGERNCNPGNIRISPSKWVGKIIPSQDNAFEQFTKAEYGIRALAIILLKYYTDYRLETVAQIINRWAPPSDNNPTTSYIDNVSAALGVAPDKEINLMDAMVLGQLVSAIIRQENGQNTYDTGTISSGVMDAIGHYLPKASSL